MSVDFDKRYSVAGYEGIAFYLKCHPEDNIVGLDDEYIDDPPLNTDMVVAVMVGDDREHIIDVQDLTMLDDDDYCSECGQIGCVHDGR